MKYAFLTLIVVYLVTFFGCNPNKETATEGTNATHHELQTQQSLPEITEAVTVEEKSEQVTDIDAISEKKWDKIADSATEKVLSAINDDKKEQKPSEVIEKKESVKMEALPKTEQQHKITEKQVTTHHEETVKPTEKHQIIPSPEPLVISGNPTLDAVQNNLVKKGQKALRPLVHVPHEQKEVVAEGTEEQQILHVADQQTEIETVKISEKTAKEDGETVVSTKIVDTVKPADKKELNTALVEMSKATEELIQRSERLSAENQQLKIELKLVQTAAIKANQERIIAEKELQDLKDSMKPTKPAAKPVKQQKKATTPAVAKKEAADTQKATQITPQQAPAVDEKKNKVQDIKPQETQKIPPVEVIKVPEQVVQPVQPLPETKSAAAKEPAKQPKTDNTTATQKSLQEKVTKTVNDVAKKTAETVTKITDKTLEAAKEGMVKTEKAVKQALETKKQPAN